MYKKILFLYFFVLVITVIVLTGIKEGSYAFF